MRRPTGLFMMLVGGVFFSTAMLCGSGDPVSSDDTANADPVIPSTCLDVTPRPPELCAAGHGIDITAAPYLAEGTGSGDQSAAIQSAILDAEAGLGPAPYPNLVCIPPASAHYALESVLEVASGNIWIAGQGAGSTLKRVDAPEDTWTHDEGSVLFVTASDVFIGGLEIQGAEYGDATYRNTHGIWSSGVTANTSNLTLCDNTLQDFRGRAIHLGGVDDFVIEHNTISRSGYGGVIIEHSNDGVVRHNTVSDIGQPDTCDSADVADCWYINAYGITTTGCSDTVPCCTSVEMADNHVFDVETWTGVMNHGGTEIVVRDNLVEDVHFPYGNTSHLYASSNAAFVNNYADLDTDGYRIPDEGWQTGSGLIPRSYRGLMLAASVHYPVSGLVVVGNTWLNVDDAIGQTTGSCIEVESMSDSVISYNRCLTTTKNAQSREGIAFNDLDSKEGLSHAYDNVIIAWNTFQVVTRFITQPTIDASHMCISENEVEFNYALPTYVVEACGGTACSSSWDLTTQSSGSNLNSGGLHLIDDAGNGWVLSDCPSDTSDVDSLTAIESAPGEVSLSWTTSGSVYADAFLVESRSCTPDCDSNPWEVLSYRLSDDPRWMIVSSNPWLIPIDPLTWSTSHSAGSWEFRVTPLNGAVTGNSQSATLVIP